MLRMVTAPLTAGDDSLPAIPLRAARSQVAKRIWRGTADDGTEFGFDLAEPLAPGATVFQSTAARYVLHQEPEPLVEITLDLPPSASAGIGWAIGNLHLELASEATRLLAPDEPAVRQLLQRLGVPYRATRGVFRPGRFARGQQPSHELGPSHRH